MPGHGPSRRNYQDQVCYGPQTTGKGGCRQNEVGWVVGESGRVEDKGGGGGWKEAWMA